jgi:hypothetical protein
MPRGSKQLIREENGVTVLAAGVRTKKFREFLANSRTYGHSAC